MVTLKDVCEKGSSNIKQSDLQAHDGEYPIYGASGFIKNVDFYQQDKPYIAVVKDGAGVGRVMKLPAYSSVISTMQYIIPHDGVSVSYLSYVMDFMELAKYRTGATIPHIYFKDYCTEKLPAHSIQEQSKIAAILDKISALIDFRKQQLEKLDELVKARFVELFGDPILNNKNWPMVTLGEIAELRIGPFGTLLHKEDYISGGHALVNPSHIINGTICTDDNLTISDSKYEELSAYQLQIGDIVLGRRGEMGRCAVVRVEGLLCGTGSMIIRPNTQMKPYFLQNIISRPEYKEIIEGKAVGITMMNLNVPIVSALSVPLLSLELQDNFTDYMSKIEKLRLTICQGLDTMGTLKRALMQEYFG